VRPRDERPNDSHAAEKRDESSSLHVTHERSLGAIPKDYHFATGRRVRNGTKSALHSGQAEVRYQRTSPKFYWRTAFRLCKESWA